MTKSFVFILCMSMFFITLLSCGRSKELVDTKGKVLVNNVKRVKSVSESKCNCNTSIIGDFCSGSTTCETTNCVEQNDCGLLLLQKCNGECRL